MITLLSKDRETIAMFLKLAKKLGVKLAAPPAVDKPLPDTAVLADADSYPANPSQRAALVAELCAHADNLPTACFGYLLSEEQRAALREAGVMVSHGPGRILLRTLVSWNALQPADTALMQDEE